jgi:hypothetical protein
MEENPVHGFAFFSTGVAAAVIVGAAISAPTFIREQDFQQLRASCDGAGIFLDPRCVDRAQ